MIHRATIGHAFWEDCGYIEEYLSDAKSPLVCFGASSLGVKVKDIFAENGYAIDYFCDNSAKLWGTTISGVPVISPARAKEINASVVITSSYYAEIKKQLEDMGVCVING
jgi:FlaA1/EpsC-like NDP-sugar epimerase